MSINETLASSARVGASAMIALDRLQISMDAVSNAENRQQLAADRVREAVEKYGAGSDQANRANLEFENSTRSLEIAHEREQVRMVYGSLVVIPSMISAIRSLGESLDVAAIKEAIFTGEVDANTAAQLANLAVASVGIAVPIALAAMTFAESQAPAPINVYGDINMNNAGPLTSASTAQFATSARP